MTVRVAISPKTSSRAERDLFRVTSVLGDDWYVWMNRGLSFETPSQGTMNREVDCVLYHRQHGLLFIECKSGNLSTRYNPDKQCTEWLQSGNVLEKSPVEQVRTLISPFHDYLKELLKAPFPKDFYHVRVQWALCLSDMDSLQGVPRAELPRRRTLLRTDLLNADKFEKRLIEILETREQSHCNAPYPNEYLDEEAFFALQDFLDGNGDKPSAKDLLYESDLFSKQAAEVQEMLMDSISENLRVRVNGVAGSGKSRLVVREALRLSRIGKSVAIACYNDLLASEIRSSMTEVLELDRKKVQAKYAADGGTGFGRVEVLSHAEWCKKYIKAAKVEIKKRVDDSDYFEKELPQGFLKALKILSRRDKKNREKFFFDSIIIDEGQDLSSEWVDNLILLLKNPETGMVRFFYDPAQRLYGKRNGIENPQVKAMPVMVLSKSCRNTRKILNWVGKKTGFKVSGYDNMAQGEVVKEFFYTDPMEQESKLITVYEELIRKYEFSPREVLVVSMRSYENSALKNLKDDRFVWNTIGNKSIIRDKVNIVSSHRIKGLDAMAVILVDVEEPVNVSDRGDYKRRLLVGATRAKKVLRVLLKK